MKQITTGTGVGKDNIIVVQGIKVAPYTYKAIATIRDGKFKIPEAKTLEGKRSASVTKDAKNAFGITEDEIPFY